MADNSRLTAVMNYIDLDGVVLVQPCWRRCFAGHAVAMFGSRPQVKEYLLRSTIEGPLFVSPKPIAQSILDLTDLQTESLFSCTNTVGQLRSKVKAIVFNYGRTKGETH